MHSGDVDLLDVSTHSRPKAAGLSREDKEFYMRRFNSQPPEGGWQTGQQRH